MSRGISVIGQRFTFASDMLAGMEGVPGIQATPDHIPGMLEVQRLSSLQEKLRAGMPKADIERGGFLVHTLTGAEFEEALNSEGVVSRVILDEQREVAGYALCHLLSKWKQSNPEWSDSIVFHDGVEPGPDDDDSILFRYVAVGPNAQPGAGMELSGTLIDKFRQLGCRAVFGETLLEPYYNRPAHFTNKRRMKFTDVGRIDERYKGESYEWLLYRKIFDQE